MTLLTALLWFALVFVVGGLVFAISVLAIAAACIVWCKNRDIDLEEIWRDDDGR